MTIDAEVIREIQTIRDHYDLILSNNEVRYNERIASEREAMRLALAAIELRNKERIETDREAVQLALKANEKRLDGMNEFRQALTDQSNLMITRKESETSRDTLNERLEQTRMVLENKINADMDGLIIKVDQFGRPNWPLMVSVLSIFLVVLGGVWLIIGLKIDSELNPLALSLQEMKVVRAGGTEKLNALIADAAASTQADAASRADRAEMNERLRTVERIAATNTTTSAEIVQKLIEVETQFCASDIVRNLTHANDTSIMSIIWHHNFPESVYPTDNSFYAQICNRQIQQSPR